MCFFDCLTILVAQNVAVFPTTRIVRQSKKYIYWLLILIYLLYLPMYLNIITIIFLKIYNDFTGSFFKIHTNWYKIRIFKNIISCLKGSKALRIKYCISLSVLDLGIDIFMRGRSEFHRRWSVEITKTEFGGFWDCKIWTNSATVASSLWMASEGNESLGTPMMSRLQFCTLCHSFAK